MKNETNKKRNRHLDNIAYSPKLSDLSDLSDMETVVDNVNQPTLEELEALGIEEAPDDL